MTDLLDGYTTSWWKEKAKQWTAGGTIDEAIKTVKAYNNKGFRVLINSIAGQSFDLPSIIKVQNNYLSLVETIYKNKLNAGITTRSTNLGLVYSFNETRKALQSVLQKAKEKNVRIEMDTEERPHVEKTMQLTTEMVNLGFSLRVCVQSGIKNNYETVIKTLHNIRNNLTFRVVTGSCYKETLELNEAETIKQYYQLMLLLGNQSAVGTHITERILCAKAIGMEAQVLLGFENRQPRNSIDTIYAAFGDWKTNEGIRGYILRREKSVAPIIKN